MTKERSRDRDGNPFWKAAAPARALLSDEMVRLHLDFYAQQAADGHVESFEAVTRLCHEHRLPIPEPLSERLPEMARLWQKGEDDLGKLIGWKRKRGRQPADFALVRDVQIEILTHFKDSGGKDSLNAAITKAAHICGVSHTTATRYWKRFWDSKAFG